jgi:hypothetical protein
MTNNKVSISLWVSILLTILAMAFFSYNIKNDFFPDSVIQKYGSKYSSYFSESAKAVEDGLLHVQSAVDSGRFFVLPLKDEIQFLSEQLNQEGQINGLMILNHTGRFSILMRDQNTFLFATDTASEINNVTWYRIDQKQKVVNTFGMALGIDLNILKWGEHIFNDSYQYNTPLWSSSQKLFGTNNANIVSHITWRDAASKELVTCFAIIDSGTLESFASSLYQDHYLSYLVNLSGDKIPVHVGQELKNDSVDQTKGIYQTSIDSWESTGNHVPSTFNYHYQNKSWWGQSLPIENVAGLNAMVFNVDEQTLYSSIFIDHILELLVILILLILSLGLFLKIRKKRHPSLEEFVKGQSIDLQISELIQQGENSKLEFKSSFRYDYHLKVVNKELEGVIAKSIAAFSNGKGGSLLIGVDDEGHILGLENDISTLKRKDIDFFENTLRTFLNKTFSVSLVTQNLHISFPVIEEKAICRIDIDQAKSPVFVELTKNSQKSERFYVRSGNTSQEIQSLSEMNEYINSRFP